MNFIICRSCGQPKQYDAYHRDRHSTTGRAASCIECKREARSTGARSYARVVFRDKRDGSVRVCVPPRIYEALGRPEMLRWTLDNNDGVGLEVVE